MKFSVALVTLSAAAAYGQGISDIPSCALSCFLGPLQSDGCKGLTDFKCHCSKPSLLPKVVPCVAKSCPADVAKTVGEKAVALCKANGVDITIPSTGGSSSAAPKESSAAGGASSTPAASSAEATSGYGGATTSGYAAPTGTGSSGNSTGTTFYPSPPTSTGGASKAGAVGGAAALALGVAAML